MEATHLGVIRERIDIFASIWRRSEKGSRKQEESLLKDEERHSRRALLYTQKVAYGR